MSVVGPVCMYLLSMYQHYIDISSSVSQSWVYSMSQVMDLDHQDNDIHVHTYQVRQQLTANLREASLLVH
jgi:hypothetical protein